MQPPETAAPVLSPQERRGRNREEMRRAILDAACAVMREQGVAALSLREVARRVKLQAPSLYAYFPSKMALYDALFVEGIRTFRTYKDPVAPRLTSGRQNRARRTGGRGRPRTRPRPLVPRPAAHQPARQCTPAYLAVRCWLSITFGERRPLSVVDRTRRGSSASGVVLQPRRDGHYNARADPHFHRK